MMSRNSILLTSLARYITFRYIKIEMQSLFGQLRFAQFLSNKYTYLCDPFTKQFFLCDCIIKLNISTGYGYGTLANILCCLCSLGGVIVLPCANKSVYRILMATFIGLAVSTLSSDALLHLLPMVIGKHTEQIEKKCINQNHFHYIFW